jgi:hypothetical protein
MRISWESTIWWKFEVLRSLPPQNEALMRISWESTIWWKLEVLRSLPPQNEALLHKVLFQSFQTVGPRGILYPQKLAISSSTSGGRSVDIVRSWTQTMEFVFVCFWDVGSATFEITKLATTELTWFMHPVARVSINKYRNLRTQQMLVHSLVCIFPLMLYARLAFSILLGLCILLRVYQSISIETSVRNKCWCTV